MKKEMKKLLVLSLFLPIAFLVKANTGKTDFPLQGHVTDAVTKKPVCGVTVSASLPGTGTSKEVITDADGYFSFIQLPIAQLNVQFDKKGYQSLKKAGVVIKEKTAVKIDIEFSPENGEDGGDISEYPLLRRMFHLD